MNYKEKFLLAYRIFGLIVVLLMITLGLFLLFSDYFKYLSWEVRIAFASMLILIGAFRIVNMWIKYKRQKDEKEFE
jgi:hypothetical protein